MREWSGASAVQQVVRPRRDQPDRGRHARLAVLLDGAPSPAEREGAAALLRGRAHALAPFVAHVLGTIDPERLVVAGPIVWDPALYQLQLLREALVAFAPQLAERLPELVPSAFGRDTTAVSPAALILREVYTPPLEGSAWRTGEPSAGTQIRRRAFSPPAVVAQAASSRRLDGAPA